jgi:hypothetical protein
MWPDDFVKTILHKIGSKLIGVATKLLPNFLIWVNHQKELDKFKMCRIVKVLIKYHHKRQTPN